MYEYMDIHIMDIHICSVDSMNVDSMNIQHYTWIITHYTWISGCGCGMDLMDLHRGTPQAIIHAVRNAYPPKQLKPIR